MKKATLFFIALIAFMASSRAYSFSAVAPSGQTLYYEFQSGYNVTVTYPNASVTNMYSGLQWDGYTKPTGDLIIPSTVTYNNVTYSVKYIGPYSFYNCSGLTSVTIPSSVTDIYDYAFKFCSSLDSIVMQPCTPPSAIFGYYISIADDVDIYIENCACYQNYLNSTYGNLYKLHTLDVNLPYEYTVTAHTNLGYNGSFSAKGNIVNPCGSADTLDLRYIDRDQHYHFSHWSDGSTETPHIVVLTQDTAFEAVFVPDTFTVSVTVNNGSYGYVNVTTAQSAYGDTVHLVATPLSGYRFSHWAKSGSSSSYIYENPYDMRVMGNTQVTACFEEIKYQLNLFSSPYEGGNTTGGGYFTPGFYTITATPAYGYSFRKWDDSVTDNQRTIYLNQDTSFVAIFEGLPFSLTLNSTNEDYGTVEGSGSYPYHSHVQIKALPFDHHHFVKWWSPQNPTEFLYNSTEIITMEGDMMYHAYFAVDTYHVSVQSNNVMYGGVTGGGTFQYGDPCTIEATPYSGYRFVRWSNGVYYNPYTFVPTADVDIIAYFADEGSIVNLSINVNDPSMGSVTGGGPYAVGMVAVLEAIPNMGYHFDHWSDGSTANPRQIPMTQDISLTAYFAPGGVGIDEIDNDDDIDIHVQYDRIIVNGVTGETVRVFDIVGRPVVNGSLPSGVYLVKVGLRPARKVVVIR